MRQPYLNRDRRLQLNTEGVFIGKHQNPCEVGRCDKLSIELMHGFVEELNTKYSVLDACLRLNNERLSAIGHHMAEFYISSICLNDGADSVKERLRMVE